MAHNEKRAAKMKLQTVRGLEDIVKSGSLSKAVAQYELNRRARNGG